MFAVVRSGGKQYRVAENDVISLAKLEGEVGAKIGEQTAVAANKAEEVLTDGALTAKIKSKMALDDTVRSRSIDVTTRDHVVTAFATAHTVPALGFLVWDRRLKLKDEYVGLPGDQIRDLRLGGTVVTREVRTPLVAYTGDTSPAGFDNFPPVYQAKILITEMSFIRPNHRREKIHKFGHMHLDDFVERAERFQNEVIICSHFSTRYHPREVKSQVAGRLPPGLRERVILWV